MSALCFVNEFVSLVSMKQNNLFSKIDFNWDEKIMFALSKSTYLVDVSHVISLWILSL